MNKTTLTKRRFDAGFSECVENLAHARSMLGIYHSGTDRALDRNSIIGLLRDAHGQLLKLRVLAESLPTGVKSRRKTKGVA